MKIKPNQKANASLATQMKIMAHVMFASVGGLSIWKGTGLGLAAAFFVWLALQGAAWFLLSMSLEEDGKGKN